jgi:hypothetical protein
MFMYIKRMLSICILVYKIFQNCVECVHRVKSVYIICMYIFRPKFEIREVN